MLEATSEASNRNAQDLALVIYKTHMSMILDSQGGRVPFIKEAVLEAHHNRSLDAALAEFSSIATMGLERQIEDARVKLCTKVELEKVRYFELNAMRNPFKDLEMYAIPAGVALLGWILATATDVSCSHDICEVAETSFKNVVCDYRISFRLMSISKVPHLNRRHISSISCSHSVYSAWR